MVNISWYQQYLQKHDCNAWLQCNVNIYHIIIRWTESFSLTCLTLCRFIIFLVVFRIEHYILKLNKKDFQLYDFALVWRNIVPLAMLIIRLSRLSACSISDSFCAGHRMGRWSYIGFMRWCTSDGSASGWEEGLQAWWGVRKLDASWLQAFYDFWHIYEIALIRHIWPFIIPVSQGQISGCCGEGRRPEYFVHHFWPVLITILVTRLGRQLNWSYALKRIIIAKRRQKLFYI